MTKLSDILTDRIRNDGPLDIGVFMALALAHPQYGYYTGRDPLGAAGDFTTAPEISQMFGELIGAWAADLWFKMGSPASFVLGEAGPGRGTLMADALRATRNVPGFHKALRLRLLEVSPVLREKQALALAGYAPAWHDDVEAFMADGAGPMIVIANELFDALPVRQLQYGDGRWLERRVGLDSKGALMFGLAPAPRNLIASVPPSLNHVAQNGDIFEVSPARLGFMDRICAGLRQRGGALLAIDYGHDAPGSGDTLQAMRGHAFTPVLDNPGEADLTAHVDFAALADAARHSGCAVSGPVTQKDFLETLGIRQRAQALGAGKRDDIRAALQRLTSPDQMGCLFKVISVTSTGDLIPAGF